METKPQRRLDVNAQSAGVKDSQRPTDRIQESNMVDKLIRLTKEVLTAEYHTNHHNSQGQYSIRHEVNIVTGLIRIADSIEKLAEAVRMCSPHYRSDY